MNIGLLFTFLFAGAPSRSAAPALSPKAALLQGHFTGAKRLRRAGADARVFQQERGFPRLLEWLLRRRLLHAQTALSLPQVWQPEHILASSSLILWKKGHRVSLPTWRSALAFRDVRRTRSAELPVRRGKTFLGLMSWSAE